MKGQFEAVTGSLVTVQCGNSALYLDYPGKSFGRAHLNGEIHSQAIMATAYIHEFIDQIAVGTQQNMQFDE